jgi:SUMO ligase MMS21 Smc5/6 complex component
MRDISEIIARIEDITIHIKEQLDDVEELVQELATVESEEESVQSLDTEDLTPIKDPINSLITAALTKGDKANSEETPPSHQVSKRVIREEGRKRAQQLTRDLEMNKKEQLQDKVSQDE